MRNENLTIKKVSKEEIESTKVTIDLRMESLHAEANRESQFKGNGVISFIADDNGVQVAMLGVISRGQQLDMLRSHIKILELTPLEELVIMAGLAGDISPSKGECSCCNEEGHRDEQSMDKSKDDVGEES